MKSLNGVSQMFLNSFQKEGSFRAQRNKIYHALVTLTILSRMVVEFLRGLLRIRKADVQIKVQIKKNIFF